MAAPLNDKELFARLVAFDSVSGKSNQPIADFICEYLGGARSGGVEILQRHNEDNSRVNIVARIAPNTRSAGATERDGLILCGHMDVVPANEPEWRSDPFSLRDVDDTYVARGACDMKGSLALMMNIARGATDARLRAPLVLIITYDEELGTVGASALADEWDNPFPLPSSAIVGEPTDMEVVRMHKGHTAMRLRLRGRSAHSAYPHLGVNAIEPLGRAINALVGLRQEWQRERARSSVFYPQTPYVTLNLATLRGGSAINIIPDACDLEFSMRVLPGMDSSVLQSRVRQALDKAGDLGDYEIELLSETPPMLCPEDAHVHQIVGDLISQKNTVAVSYASDAGVLACMGIECVLFGPGSIEAAHKPNEFVPRKQFDQARQTLDRAFRSFCVAS